MNQYNRIPFYDLYHVAQQQWTETRRNFKSIQVEREKKNIKIQKSRFNESGTGII